MNTTTTTGHQVRMAKAQMAAGILQSLISSRDLSSIGVDNKPEQCADHFDFEMQVAMILAERIYKATPA